MANVFETNTDFGRYRPDEFELEALNTINNEKQQWDDAAVFVTEKEQYLMRNVIKQARRYYAGIYQAPYDEITGDKKTWVPTTKWSVESVVKSVDIDQKDVLITPGRPSAVGIVPLIRAAVLNLFKKIEFGQLLNDLTRVMATDGTVVVKSYTVIDPKTNKKVIRSKIVNLLNLWLDPASASIQDGPIIERSDATVADIQAYKNVWENTDKIIYTTNVPKIYDVFNAHASALPETEIWERWGPMKKSWITKNHKDKDIIVEGHIIASGHGQAQIIHLIRKNPRKDGRKPYEECWYRRLSGRWYGEGVPEMLFDLQEYVNLIVNTRKANNMVLQNGIFLIRKGSGITPDMLGSITAGGGLPVTNINNDIKQLQVTDYRQSSYTDEDRAYSMADRVTSSFDINRGEAGRASASATATLTQDRNIRDTFVLVQEGIGFFVERLIVNQYIPLLKETMTEDDYIKVTGDADYLAIIDGQIVKNRLNTFIQKKVESTGFYPDQAEIDAFIEKQAAYLKSMGKQRFVKYMNDMFDEEIDIDVHITDEKFNRVVAVQQLRDALLAYSRLPVASKLDTDAILREMFNLMGIKGEFFLEKAQLPAHAIQKNNGETGRLLKEMGTGLPSETTQFENAMGIPQQGMADMGAGAMGGTGGAPLKSNLDINTELTQL